MAKNDNVKFVRIRGRIVPIRKKKEEVRKSQGKALVAAGIVIAASSGLAAGRLFKASSKLGKTIDLNTNILLKSQSQLGSAAGMSSQFSKIVTKRLGQQRKKMGAGFKASRALMGFGTILGAGLIGEGLPRIASGGKESGISADVLGNVTGLAASFAVTRSFKIGATKKLINQVGKVRPRKFDL